MAEQVTLKISTAAAAYVGKDAPKEERLKAAGGKLPFPPNDLATLLFFLAHDGDPEVRGTAVRTLRGLPEPLLVAMAGFPTLHPRVLDLLARLHFAKPAVAEKIVTNPGVGEGTLAFLVEKGVVASGTLPEEDASPEELPEPGTELPGSDDAAEPEEEGEVDEESEEFQSKYQLSQLMGVSEKIKMALTGDKEWRSLLIKDSNKLVSSGVMKNPRITEPEVLSVAKSAVQNDEIMRLICANKEWVKNYQIRKALVENHKTPLPFALKQLSSLSEKDIAALAKSKNVSSVVSTQARRILLNKQKK